MGPLALAVSLALTGCGGPGPAKVTKQFLTAVEKGDMASLHKYATSESVSTVKTFAEKAKGGVRAKGGVVSAKEKIDGDKAEVTVKFKDGSEEKVDLVRVKGKWKVAIKK